MSKNKERKVKRSLAENLRDKNDGVFIVLNMIVGNEEDNILRCLNSVHNMIDSLVICCNGNRPATTETIQKFMLEHSLPGRTIPTTWSEDHYGWSRTEALRHAEDFMYDLSQNEHKAIKNGMKYYVMFMDADDYAIDDKQTEGKFMLNRKSLTADNYNVYKLRTVKFDFPFLLKIYPDISIKHIMKHLTVKNYYIEMYGANENDSEEVKKAETVKVVNGPDDEDSDSDFNDGPVGPEGPEGPDMEEIGPVGPVGPNETVKSAASPISGQNLQPVKRWRWRGCRHEVPETTDWHSEYGFIVAGGFIMSNSAGCRAKDPLTYLKDLYAFMKELKRKPGDSRATFYAGESAKSAGMFNVAKVYYKQCLMTNFGFNEEKYYAALQLVKYETRPNRERKKIEKLLLAYQWCPERYEAPHDLLMIWNSQKMYHQAYTLAKTISAKPAPVNGLFMDLNVNEWRFYDVASVSAWQSGDKELFKELCKKALRSTRIPQGDRDRIKDDMRKWG